MRLRTPDDFTGTVAVVTGASSGIGRATARAFAERGAQVTLAARDEGSLREAADDCRAAGGQALAAPTDVTDEDQVHALARQAVDRFGQIDVWVNNAAVMVYGRFEDTPGDVHRRVIETNLLGQIHGARAVLPQFRRQGRGVLVNVASLYARMTSPYVSAYVTSKFGVIGFSEVLRQELHDDPGIHVCTILPSSVDTPIFRHAGNYTGQSTRPIPPVADPARVVRAILRSVERPRKEVTVGQVGHLLAWGHALLPGLYGRLAPYAMDVAGLGPDTVDNGPGNVWEPMPRWNRVNGDWRHERRLVRAAVPAGAALAPLVGWRLRRRTRR